MKRTDVRLRPQRFLPSGIAPPSKPPVVNPETALVPLREPVHTVCDLEETELRMLAWMESNQ